MSATPGDAVEWLRRFADLVREQAYKEAMGMFDENVVSFGTVVRRSAGIEMLVTEQWCHIWPNTRNFAFDLAEAHFIVLEGGVVVAVQWFSDGLHRVTGVEHLRTGRATVVLKTFKEGLKATHTHFSLDPQREAFLAQ